MSEPRFYVGQTVVVNDVNRRRGEPARAEVVKVGRTLVHVTARWGSGTEAYRIETGVRNDDYHHQSICTEAGYAESQVRADLLRRLREQGFTAERVGPKRSNELLAQIVALLEETA